MTEVTKIRKQTELGSLQEGDRFDDLVLVKAVKSGETRAGKAYLVVTVQDRSGELSGPVWDNAELVQAQCPMGTVVRLTGLVQSYRDSLQLKIDCLQPVPPEQVAMEDFLPASPHDRSLMAADLLELVKSVRNPYIKKLLFHFFGKGEWWERFQEAPAAKGVHHAYVGGLLEHSLSVGKLVAQLGDHYPGIDKSLLVAGALLHDIGKLEELEMVGGIIDYTVKGRLKGHLVIGSEMVDRVARKVRDFPEDLLEQLQHLILSHHGRQEYGSPTVPMTVESFILSMIDDLDAKMNIAEQLRRKMNGGDMGWSDYQRILERYLYLGGFDQLPETQVAQRPDNPASRQQSLF